MRSALVWCLPFLAAACVFDASRLADDVIITCSASQPLCPASYVCSERLGRCVRENGDKDAPSLLSATITPPVINRAGTSTITFTTSEQVFGEPVLSLTGAALTQREPVNSGERFTYSAHVSDGDLEGVHQVTAGMTDLSGNDGTATVGPLTFDFTPPRVLLFSVKIQPALARPGETVLVQVAFSEALLGTPRIHLPTGEGFDALSSEGALATFQVPIPVGTTDGPVELSLDTISDLAGNTTMPGIIGSVRVDTTAPRIDTLEIVDGYTVRSAQPGFNTFTVRVVGNAGTGDSLRALEVRFLGQLLTCTAPLESTRECPVTIVGTEPEGEVTIEALATDSAGNSFVKTLPIRLDFTAPHIALETLQSTLIAAPGSLLPQVAALGPGSRAVLTFSLTEPVVAGATFTLGGQSLNCGSTGLTWACQYTHACAALTDGAQPLSATLTDAVGNRFTGNPSQAFTVRTDCTPPLAPRVDVSGKVVWHRAPWGSAFSPGRVGSQLEVAADAVAEGDTVVRLGNGTPDGGLTAIASGRIADAGVTSIEVTDEVDRVKVSAQAVDSAGNGSPVVVVRDNVSTVAMLGAQALSTGPKVFKSLASDDSLTGAFDALWASSTVRAPSLKVTPLVGPSPRETKLTALPNGQALLFGGFEYYAPRAYQVATDSWRFDVNTGAWWPVLGTQPPQGINRNAARSTDGRVFTFGGDQQEAQQTWAFNPATQRWANLTAGLTPPARAGAQLEALPDGRILMYGGRSNASGELNDLWVFDPITARWSMWVDATPTQRLDVQVRVLSGGTVVRFGGSQRSPFISITQYYNDIATLNPTTHAWEPFTPSPTPFGRAGYTLVPLSNNMMLLVSGDSGDLLSSEPQPGDCWLFDGTTNTWVDVSPASAQVGPEGRVGAHVVALSGGKALVYGGYANYVSPDRTLGDAWLFDATTRTWSAVTGELPPPRQKAALTRLSTGDVLLVGGVDDPASVAYSDTWRFDAASNRFSRMSRSRVSWRYAARLAPAGSEGAMVIGGTNPNTAQNTNDSALWLADAGGWVPQANSPVGSPISASAVGSGDVLATTMTSNAQGTQFHAYRYRQVTGAWSEIDAGTQPSSNAYGQLVTLNNGDVWLDETGRFNAQWRYRADSGTWDSIISTTTPPARQALTPLAISDGRLFFFGGSTNFIPSNALDDTWVFSFTTGNWSQQQTGPRPPGRERQPMAQLADGRIMMFSGSPGTSIGQPLPSLEDTWLFDLQRNQWAEVTTTVHPPVADGAPLFTLPSGATVMLPAQYTNTENGSPNGWVFDPATLTWAQLAGRARVGVTRIAENNDNLSAIQLASGDVLLVGGSGGGDTFRMGRGEALSAVGAFSIDRLAIDVSQIQSLTARVTAGADGRSADDSTDLPGALVQVYRSAPTGPLFQTCATAATASASSAQALSCTDVPVTGGTHLGVRVIPRGFSHGRVMGLTVSQMELDVRYRSAP